MGLLYISIKTDLRLLSLPAEGEGLFVSQFTREDEWELNDSFYDENEVGGHQKNLPLIEAQVGMSYPEIEKRSIVATLHYCNGNRKNAAKMLGICERTLYNKMRQYKIRIEIQKDRPIEGDTLRCQ